METRIQVSELRPGDVLTASGRIVTSAGRGLGTPVGYTEVVLADGRKGVWRSPTVVRVSRLSYGEMTSERKLDYLAAQIEAAKAAVDAPSFSRQFAGLRKQAARSRLDRLQVLRSALLAE